jgi:multidrug transporter EmrE-like cation transporter
MTTAENAVTRGYDLLAWSNLAAAIALLNAGNLLLDRVAKAAGISMELFLSPGLFVAIACLGLAFLFYVRSLAKLPLAVAYPVMVGVSMIVVAVTNHLWGEQQLSPIQMTGVLVLFFGVVLISTGQRSS